MMRQYLALKEKHPGAVLFFRMGDFYEMFLGDAELAARELGLTLTTRDKGKPGAVPMAGVPWHAAEGYIAKLVAKGHRVAVCEQTGDPKTAKGLVDRSVVEIVTPGTAFSTSLVPEDRNNFVAAVHRLGDRVGFAAADVTTGEFLLEDLDLDRLEEDLARLEVSEWVVSDAPEAIRPRGEKNVLSRPGWWFEAARGRREILEHLGVESLAGFDCEDLGPALGAAGALLDYLREVRGGGLDHLVRVQRFGVADYMVLDATTRRNLELTAPLSGDAAATTLLGALNRTVTAPGARRLRAWMERPLLDRGAIVARLDAVEELTLRPAETVALRECLSGLRDVERLLGRAASGKATPRDLRSLGEAASVSPVLRERLGVLDAALWRGLAESAPDLGGLGTRICDALVEAPPVTAAEGGLFRAGWNGELDAIRDRARGGKAWIAQLQARERAATGISSLKIGYNKVFGYYLEVTKAHHDRVPETYIRKQTLVNAERYVTPELKEEEERILGAEEKLKAMELDLFGALRGEAVAEAAALQALADAIATADVLQSLARVAGDHGYRRPTVTGDLTLRFREGRHPVVERLLGPGEFVPNDLDLDGENRQIAVITGPNMAGKSTYLRQAGLIAILAQMGSFVPAAEAEVGLVDRVFTRVGASDSIARGQSTFMVEMQETATILNAATERSLVLLDEVGRGTSTYDGLGIAWAVTEFLHERAGGRPRTLFATHYHELTGLAEQLPRLINLNVQVKEWNGKVIFLRKIVEGAADKSYGIHVAELAGLPPAVTKRAREVLGSLEAGRFDRAEMRVHGGNEPQLTLFEPVRSELARALDDVAPDAMTPLEALALLHEWKRRFGGDA
jgi:DNA mismatch repair protein MutS